MTGETYVPDEKSLLEEYQVKGETRGLGFGHTIQY